MMKKHDDPQIDCFRRLRKTGKIARKVLSGMLHTHGLTHTQFQILRRIPEGGIPLTQLASQSWIDPGNVSGIVDRLECQGLVSRERSTKDRRVVLLSRTPECTALIERIHPVFRSTVKNFMSILNPEETGQLAVILDKLAQAANAPADSVEGKSPP
jgi:DNA-binding MarR family transcriptional regulator